MSDKNNLINGKLKEKFEEELSKKKVKEQKEVKEVENQTTVKEQQLKEKGNVILNVWRWM